jgi:hypothetical protein
LGTSPAKVTAVAPAKVKEASERGRLPFLQHTSLKRSPC